MIGAVTNGFDSTQASATTAGFVPNFSAVSTTRLRIASSCRDPSPKVTLNGSVRPRTVEASAPTPSPQDSRAPSATRE